MFKNTPKTIIGIGYKRFQKKEALLVPESVNFNERATKHPKFDFSELKKHGIERIGEINPYITTSCNLRCHYCYMFDFLVKPTDKSQQMSPEFLLSMLEYFSNQRGGLDRSTLLGGEPTLHQNITEIVKAMSEMPITERRMTTNGISTNRLRLEELPQNAFDHVSISIDGIKSEINDLTRGIGSFEEAIKTIQKYKEAGIKLSINYTVTNNNIHTLNETATFFAKKGVSILNFHRASLNGNTLNSPGLLVNAKDWVKARDSLLDDLKKNKQKYSGLKIRIPWIFLTPAQIIELDYKPIQEQNYHSPDGGHRLIVFPPTNIGQGLCYMSSDLVGQPNAHLGYITPEGKFKWNDNESNELTAYRNSKKSNNISTKILNQEDIEDTEDLKRVSHSFKKEIQC